MRHGETVFPDEGCRLTSIGVEASFMKSISMEGSAAGRFVGTGRSRGEIICESQYTK